MKTELERGFNYKRLEFFAKYQSRAKFVHFIANILAPLSYKALLEKCSES